MSDLRRQRPDPEDLSVLARRGHASRADEHALERALEHDATLRIAHQVGVDLDRDTAVRAGDEDLILRAVDAVPVRMAPARTRRGEFLRGWQVAAALVAAAVLSGSGVGLALWVAGVTPWSEPERSSVAGTAPDEHSVRRKVRAPSTRTPHPVEAVVQTTPVAPAPIFARAPEGALRPGSEAPSVGSPAPAHPGHVSSHQVLLAGGTARFDARAAELFRAANEARRAGEFARAKRLYAELIRRDPTTDEAHVAHVSLGKLLFAQAQFAQAEREFQRYLSAGGGPLSEEALFNRAESLQRLGRLDHEQQAWRALLGAYPDSLYGARARQRLSAAAP